MTEKVTDIEELVKAILLRNQELLDRNLALEAENTDLCIRLARYEQPKDSHNNGLPSSILVTDRGSCTEGCVQAYSWKCSIGKLLW